MFTYSLRCDPGRAEEAVGGRYAVVELGSAVRVLESYIALYAGEMPLCVYKSWRLTYNDVSPLGLSRAEVLVRGDRTVVRLVRPDERLGLPEMAEGSPLVVHAMDVNEGGVVYRVFRMGGYVELAARGVAASVAEAFHPRRGVNLLVVDLPLAPQFERQLKEVLELARGHYVELHTTMLSDVCPICGERMDKRGRMLHCPRCRVRLNRDVNAVWTLARNIVRRLGREAQLAELREIFQLNYPDV